VWGVRSWGGFTHAERAGVIAMSGFERREGSPRASDPIGTFLADLRDKGLPTIIAPQRFCRTKYDPEISDISWSARIAYPICPLRKEEIFAWDFRGFSLFQVYPV